MDLRISVPIGQLKISAEEKIELTPINKGNSTHVASGIHVRQASPFLTGGGEDSISAENAVVPTENGAAAISFTDVPLTPRQKKAFESICDIAYNLNISFEKNDYSAASQEIDDLNYKIKQFQALEKKLAPQQKDIREQVISLKEVIDFLSIQLDELHSDKEKIKKLNMQNSAAHKSEAANQLRELIALTGKKYIPDGDVDVDVVEDEVKLKFKDGSSKEMSVPEEFIDKLDEFHDQIHALKIQIKEKQTDMNPYVVKLQSWIAAHITKR